MELWIPVTVAAALLQTWRTALQQKLRDKLSVNAAGFVRYLYALPTGVLLVAGFHAAAGAALPVPSLRFLLLCAVGGLLQIVGTNLLIMAFGYRSFAVGTAYAKTEAVQGAVLAFFLLHEALTPLAVLGIAVGVGGVLVLSLAGRGLRPHEFLRATLQPAALCGLGAGFIFALTAICIKEANRALGVGGGLEAIVRQAVFALLVTNVLQTLMQGSYLALREPDQLRAAFRTWRSSAWVGTLSACGSACWFTGFALAPVALVRSLGQVEMVFTLLFSRFYLKETLRRADVIGLVLVVAGVILILRGR
jgi:drug/metabolite transporter (DMT)-like permease